MINQFKNFLRGNIETKMHCDQITLLTKNALFASYQQWFSNVKDCVHKRQYRRVLRMIQQIPNDYSECSNFFDLETIKLHCIIKIITHKMIKYSLKIKDDRLDVKKVIDFWFNQMYFTLHHLILEIRPDLNDDLDFGNEATLNKIELAVIQALDCIYLMITYSNELNEMGEICAYFAMESRLEMFILFCRNPLTLYNFQKVLLLKSRLLISNLDYENALLSIEKTLSVCFREFFLLVDFDEGLNCENLIGKKTEGMMVFKCLLNMVFAFYQRGICYEALGNITKGIEAYKQSSWICGKFLKTLYPLIVDFFNMLLKRSFNYHKIITDIQESIDETKEKNSKDNQDKNMNDYESESQRQHRIYLQRIVAGESIPNIRRMEKAQAVISNVKVKDFDVSEKKHYPKSSYITSTMTLINHLLNDNFKPTIMEMKSVNINCLPSEDQRRVLRKINDIKNLKDIHFCSNKQYSTLKAIKTLHGNLIPPFLPNNNNSLSISINSSSNLMNRTNSCTPSLRYYPDKVEKIEVDQYNLDKDYQEKRAYIEKYHNKEIQFHKSLLECKKHEKKGTVDLVSIKNEKNKTEFFYKRHLATAKKTDAKIFIDKRGFESLAELKIIEKKAQIENMLVKSLSTKFIDIYEKENDMLKRQRKKLIANGSAMNAITSRITSASVDNVKYSNGWNEAFIKKIDCESAQLEALRKKKMKQNAKRIKFDCLHAKALY